MHHRITVHNIKIPTIGNMENLSPLKTKYDGKTYKLINK
jgi:hypothetical protein